MYQLASNQKNVSQPRLEIGRPDDKYEKEADAVADRVMRMPSSENLQMKPGEQTSAIQMKSAQYEEEEKLQMKVAENSGNMLRMKHAGSEGKMMAPESVTRQLMTPSGSGRPLPKRVQREMGSKMGADFSGVKIHTDNNAVQLSRDLGAKAFTVGNDIYFNKGQYSPDSGNGKRLLAHELAHVVQQGPTTNFLASRMIQKTEAENDEVSEGIDIDTFSRASGLEEMDFESLIIQFDENMAIVIDIGNRKILTTNRGTVRNYFSNYGGRASMSSAAADRVRSALYSSTSVVNISHLLEPVVERSVTVIDMSGEHVDISLDDALATQMHWREWIMENQHSLDQAFDRYLRQLKLNSESPRVASFSRTVGWANHPDRNVIRSAYTHFHSAYMALAMNPIMNLADAKSHFEQAWDYAVEADQQIYEYIDRIIGGAERSVTALEYTRDAAFGIVTVAATVTLTPIGAGALKSGLVLGGNSATSGMVKEIATQSGEAIWGLDEFNFDIILEKAATQGVAGFIGGAVGAKFVQALSGPVANRLARLGIDTTEEAVKNALMGPAKRIIRDVLVALYYKRNDISKKDIIRIIIIEVVRALFQNKGLLGKVPVPLRPIEYLNLLPVVP